MMRKYLPTFKDSQPTLVKLFIILLGSNNASLGTHQRVPVDIYERNVEVIMSDVKERYLYLSYLVITPPPLGTGKKAEFVEMGTGVYVEAARRAARSNGAQICDLFARLESNSDECLSDGLHMNDTGYQNLKDGVFDAIAAFTDKEIAQPRKTLPYRKEA